MSALGTTAVWKTPDLSGAALHVWHRNFDVFRRIWRTESLGIGLEPWIVILAMGFGLGRFVELDGGVEYIEFLAPGLLAMFPMFAAIFECGWGSFMRMEQHRTYEAVLSTPASVDDLITGDILWGTTRSTFNATYILAVLLILGPWTKAVDSPAAILVVPIALLQGFLFSSLAMSFASFARSMTHFGYLFNLVVMPMFWLSGGFFPLENLPDWSQRAAWFMPLVHSVELNRAALSGDLHLGLLVDVAWLLAGCIVFYRLALVLMRRRLIV
jgi:lipooligosaccharide transport system permease protein